MANLITSPLKKIQEDVVSITWTRVQEAGPGKGLTHGTLRSRRGMTRHKHSDRTPIRTQTKKSSSTWDAMLESIMRRRAEAETQAGV